ncbi:MAG TPA: hypothetical protein ENJ43_01430 [Gammaproteobacteria bacterium]|nr:hypothetical protein [Gammaproteobacteria bacterium]
MEPTERIRIDKWLWAARFFKSRGLARKAVEGGKVHCNGRRVKPSHSIRAGDELEIQQGGCARTVQILRISGQRGPAAFAAKLYRETEESILRREKEAQLRRSQAIPGLRRHGHGRPAKRERRHIIRFTRGEGG